MFDIEAIFRWLERVLPGGRLYGPYTYDGRIFYQWMVRGPYLRNVVVPFLASRRAYMDEHIEKRFLAMCDTYEIDISGVEPWPGGFDIVEEARPAYICRH